MRGDVHRFLAGGGVQHEQDFLRLHKVAQADEFLHERLVNLQTARGVEDQNVPVVRAREVERLAGDFLHFGFAAFDERGNFELLAERFELVHRRRTIHVRRDQQRRAALLVQQARELAAGGRLARAVQADQEDATRIAAEIQPRVGRAEQLDEFVMDDFDDLLAGLDALDDFDADGFGFDALDEIARDLEVHVGFEQGHAHFAQRVGDVALGDFSEAAQVAEGVLEFAA